MRNVRERGRRRPARGCDEREEAIVLHGWKAFQHQEDDHADDDDEHDPAHDRNAGTEDPVGHARPAALQEGRRHPDGRCGDAAAHIGWRRHQETTIVNVIFGSRRDRGTVHRDLLELGDAQSLQRRPQWRVVHRSRQILTLGQHPREEVDERSRRRCFGLVLVDERPGQPGDRICLRIRRLVDDVDPQIGWVAGDADCGVGGSLLARLDEVSPPCS